MNTSAEHIVTNLVDRFHAHGPMVFRQNNVPQPAFDIVIPDIVKAEEDDHHYEANLRAPAAAKKEEDTYEYEENLRSPYLPRRKDLRTLYSPPRMPRLRQSFRKVPTPLSSSMPEE